MDISSEEDLRGCVVTVLRSWEKGNGFLSNLLQEAWQRTTFSERDRALITITANGVIRRKKALDWLIDRFSHRRTPAGPSLIRQILRLSLFHLLYLDSIPSHAVLHQAGELGEREKLSSRELSYINGLLRTTLRELSSLPFPPREREVEYISVVHSHPSWLVSRWLKQWAFQEVEELCRVNNLPPPVFIRCNLLKSEPKCLEVELRAEGIDCEQYGGEKTGIWKIKAHNPIDSFHSFRDGHFQVQDPSTLRAVELLDPKPGERIADLCAAPGGKASYIAQKMENTGLLLAADPSRGRLKKMEDNFLRLGITNATIQRINPLRDKLGGEVRDQDGILLDVPCSNTGVLRRRVDARWRISPDDITRLAVQGAELLSASADFIKPGGRIVYSTCSLEPEENEEVVRSFLETRNDYSLEREESNFPREEGGDGYYVALLRKSCNKSPQ